jgi:uncharacterized protein YgfB (UPF0149 family)
MTENILPSYEALDLALNETSLKIHPSQIHGLVCGILSGGPKDHAVWDKWLASENELANVHKILQDLFEGSARQLDAFLFEFQLMLPEDNEELSVRAEALTLWCQGYLTGLKLAAVQIEGRAPGESTEAIQDLIEIAKMHYEDVVSSEEDEVAYVELVEYVRMAVILIYEEQCGQTTSGDVTQPADHLH